MNDITLVKEGPAIITEFFNETKLDTSLRLLVDYHVATDQLVARIDVLTNNEPGQRLPGMSIKLNTNTKQFYIDLLTTDLAKSNLIVPKNAIEAGVSVQVNGKDLIRKLRALADRLEFETSDYSNVAMREIKSYEVKS